LLGDEHFAAPSRGDGSRLFPIMDESDLLALVKRLNAIRASDAEREQIRQRAVSIAMRKGLRLPPSLQRVAEMTASECVCASVEDKEAQAACRAYVSYVERGDGSHLASFSSGANAVELAKGGYALPVQKLFFIDSQKSLDSFAKAHRSLPSELWQEAASNAVAVARRLGLKIPSSLEVAAATSIGFRDEQQLDGGGDRDDLAQAVEQANEYALKRNAGQSARVMPETDNENALDGERSAREYAARRNRQMSR